MNKNNLSKAISLILGILAISFVTGFYVIAWDGPTADPPDGNVSSAPPAVSLAPGAAQEDASSDISIWVNKTVAGDLLKLQSGGSTKFTVGDDAHVGIDTPSPGGLLGLQDGNTYIDVDGSSNMTFTDVNAGTKTLTELSSGGGGGQMIYDAVVDASGGGDYTTVGAALVAGEKSIFVKAGSYNETKWNFTADGINIIGEEQGAVIIMFSDATTAIQISADNIYFENLQLRGSPAAPPYTTDYLVNIGNHKNNIVFVNCILEHAEHYLLYADNSMVKLYNCKLDGTDGADWGVVQGTWGDSVIIGSKIICDPNNAGTIGCLNYLSGSIAGNSIEGNKILVTIERNGNMSGNYIRARNLIIGGGGSYTNNYFSNNNDPGTTAMLRIQGRPIFSGNHVYLNYYAKKILSVESNFGIITGNIFDSGKDIEISKSSVQFTNNNWMGGPMTQTQTITLTSGCVNSQINQNIIRGKTNTPQIVDSGSNNNKLNNILYTN